MLQEYINKYTGFVFDPMTKQVMISISETIVMVVVPGFLAIIFGCMLGLLLYIFRPDQKFFNRGSIVTRYTYKFLDFIVNIGRSIPFIILMIAILPLTRLIVGKTIGTMAACVPLTLAAVPFMARVTEHACLNVSKGVLEAACSMGATTMQSLKYVVLPEAKINIINGAGLMLVGLVGYSSMAGTLAGGGLGALAFNYGYQRFNNTIVLITVILILLIVQIIQYLNNYICRRYSHN